MLSYTMGYLNCFITPAECVHLLNGVLTSINKEVISAAIYNLMDAKVSAKFLVLLQQHYLILSFAIFLTQTSEGFVLIVLVVMPESWREPFGTSGSFRNLEYIL